MKKVGIIAAILFVATVWAANWAVTNYGVVSVGFGLVAPAGVYFAGLAFTLRDTIHRTLARWPVLAAQGAGSCMSAAAASVIHWRSSRARSSGRQRPEREPQEQGRVHADADDVGRDNCGKPAPLADRLVNRQVSQFRDEERVVLRAVWQSIAEATAIDVTPPGICAFASMKYASADPARMAAGEPNER